MDSAPCGGNISKKQEVPKIPLPKGWKKHVRSVVLQNVVTNNRGVYDHANAYGGSGASLIFHSSPSPDENFHSVSLNTSPPAFMTRTVTAASFPEISGRSML